MSEVQSLLKIVSDGLKTLARRVEVIAERVDDVAGTKRSAKPAGKRKSPTVKKARSPNKAAPVAAKKKTVKAPTAADTVLTVISRARKGVNTAAIKQKTGYNQKKVANIIFKLKKQGKIKTLEKGLYAKV